MTNDKNRFLSGFGWGVAATAVMSLLMLTGVATGVSPMPKPVPAALLGKLGAAALPMRAMMVLAAGSHLVYGGLWGGLLAIRVRPVTIKAGLMLGIGLWVLMQLAVLPLLGWGVFGMEVTPAIAAATLVLHLIYGVVLGGLTDRGTSSAASAEAT